MEACRLHTDGVLLWHAVLIFLQLAFEFKFFGFEIIQSFLY
ncbi:Uncharacterised protein [Legionella israelensis]|nr:hypothetical protein SAMN02746069_01220 [Legionella israelensis DSM 19235]STX59693.1 Uncharacterised protein [Legionella israelensis]